MVQEVAKRKNVSLEIKDVRSFVGRHSIPIAPLTVLVGENSAGKSTCLAMLAAALSAGFPFRPAFGAAPFELGGFSSIASLSTRKLGKDQSFSFGLSEMSDDGVQASEHLATFNGDDGHPAFSTLAIQNRHGSVSLARHGERYSGTLGLNRESGPAELKLKGEWLEYSPDLAQLVVQGVRGGLPKAEPLPADIFRLVIRVCSDLRFLRTLIHSIAPIRSRPRRIYDGLGEEYSADGNHVPWLLAQLATAKSDNAFKKVLNSFGRESGLFEGIEARLLGSKTPNTPFRLMARMAGSRVNLTDVGYGVSQVLPLLAECLTMPADSLLTLQQPEVHLHPKAQAAFGSFLARLVSARPNVTVVVETHSDYILNRIRKEIGEGVLTPADVSIVFFERRAGRTKTHSIRVDAEGNIVNPPASYRRFFIEEEIGLLSRGRR